MSERNFFELLGAKWDEGKFVCVGLDSDISKLDGKNQLSFNMQIIDATRDVACAYKPNIAFYSYSGFGLNYLYGTVEYIRKAAPDVPVILDFKRGDIGNTNIGYIQEANSFLDPDAITVHPYLGGEALQPFLEMKNKGIFVLCKTSNPGSGEFQNLDVSGDEVPGGYMPLYQYVAHRVANFWNTNNNCGLVTGATFSEELRLIRQRVGDTPLLIPGIGAQGGDLEKTVTAGRNSRGQGFIINSSRGIIFAKNPRQETLNLHNAINQTLKGAEQ